MFLKVITLTPGSIGQLEKNMNCGSRIYRRSSAGRRFESNLFGCKNGVLVEAIAESTSDTEHLDLSRCGKEHADQNFAFDLFLSRFFGVVGTRLKCDFY